MAAGCRANTPIVSRHDAERGSASRACLPKRPGGLPEYPELRDAQPGRAAHAADQVCPTAPVDSNHKTESCRGRPRRRSRKGWGGKLEEIAEGAREKWPLAGRHAQDVETISISPVFFPNLCGSMSTR